jgi:hypothetical protein
MSFFAPAIFSKRASAGILLGFKVEYNKRQKVGPGVLKYVSCDDSIEAIFNAFKYCVSTGLSEASECIIDLHPQTIAEIEKIDIKVSGDSLSLAVALNLIEFTSNLKIKSKIIATGAIRDSFDLWSCNKVGNLSKKINLANTLKADIILIPNTSSKFIVSKKSLSKIIPLPIILPKATNLLESLNLA